MEFLVFCTSRNVAKAAGEFLKDRLVTAAEEEVKKASKSKRGEFCQAMTLEILLFNCLETSTSVLN